MEITEKQIINTLLFNDNANDIFRFLPADAFMVRSCGEVYSVLLDDYNNGEAHDIETLANKLVTNERTKEDALALINESIAYSDVNFDAVKSAKALFVEYNTKVAKKIIGGANFNECNIYEERDRIVKELTDLKMPTENYMTADQIVDVFEGELLAQKTENYIDICFERLKDVMRFDNGDLIILGARPSVGKSAFALQVLTEMAISGKKVLFFNLEMPQEQIYHRLLVHASGITLTRIRKHLKFNEEEVQKIKDAGERIRKMKSNFIVSTSCRTVSSICNLTRKLKPDIIAVDYLQKVTPDKEKANRANEVGLMCKQLKDLVMELDIPGFILVQLNRDSNPYKQPIMSEIKESGDIEQDGSTIMLMWKTDENDERKRCIRIDKNRNGAVGNHDFVFKGEFMGFTDGTDFEPILSDDETPMIFKTGA